MNIEFNKEDTPLIIEDKISKIKRYLSSKTDDKTIHKMHTLCVDLHICLNQIMFKENLNDKDKLFYNENLLKTTQNIQQLFPINITLNI